VRGHLPTNAFMILFPSHHRFHLGQKRRLGI